MQAHLSSLGLLLETLLVGPAIAGPASSVVMADDADATYLATLQADAAVLALADRREWRVLGHYKGRDVDRWRSQADGRLFFLSPDGKHDPAAELQATLAAFFAPVPAQSEPQPVAPADDSSEDTDKTWTDQHPQCRFPARYRWLRQTLDFDPARLPQRDCADLEDWVERLDVTQVTLVFADAYIDNPASMFGHTFLRLDQERGSELLANTVNFAATPWTENPFIYPIAGIVGWFPGLYATLPYYLKVQEYNAVENRDLWEYPLQLDADERRRLLEHLWELGPIQFRYHYFDENCSYQLLSLLEGMDPDLRLTDRYTAWVFPTTTLRTVAKHTDLVATPVFRPSHYRELVARRQLLAPGERPLARRLARELADSDLATLAGLDETRRAAVLDAAYELHRYRNGATPDAAALAHQQALLVQRGKIPVQSAPLHIEPPTPPEAGHKPGMVAAGAGLDDDGAFFRLRLRPALHDLLAPQAAYVPGTRLEMAHLSVRLSEGSGVPELEQLLLFDAASLAPSEPWITRMAWRLRTGWEQQPFTADRGECEGRGCLYYGLSGGPGLSWQGGPLQLYGFVEAEAALGGGVGRHLRLGPGAALGTLLSLAPTVRLHAESRARYPLWSAAGLLPDADAVEWLVEAGAAAHMSTNLELRAVGRGGPVAEQAALEAWLYW